jgi:hypothetical protein
VTVDKGIEFQQILASGKIAVIVLNGASDRLRDLLLWFPNALLPSNPSALANS